MDDSEQISRRRFPRVPSNYAVLVRRIGDEDVEAFGKTRTVGAGGCMFSHDGPLGDGSLLHLLIKVRGEVVGADARVAWERQVDGRWEIGVEFVRVDDAGEARLQQMFSEA
jgi:hypothetical protein